MRKTVFSIIAGTLLSLSMAASAEVAIVWQCELAEGKTSDDLIALSQSWLDAAKEIDDDFSVRIYNPIAGDSKVGSFVWIFYAPDYASWAGFMDAYAGSKAEEVDAGWDDIAPCENVPDMYGTTDLE